MHTHHKVEDGFNTCEQMLLVVYIKVKFSFDGVVDEDTGFDADLVVLAVPVGPVCDWHSIPAIRIHVS